MAQFPTEGEVKEEKERKARLKPLGELGPTERLKELRREQRSTVLEKGSEIEREILLTIEGQQELERYRKELEEHLKIRGNTAHRLSIVCGHEIQMSKLKRLHEAGQLHMEDDEGEEEEDEEDED